jgi:hypothetical protein
VVARAEYAERKAEQEARWRAGLAILPEGAAARVLDLVGWNQYDALEYDGDAAFPWPFGLANVLTHEVWDRQQALAILAEHGVFPGDYRDPGKARVR